MRSLSKSLSRPRGAALAAIVVSAAALAAVASAGAASSKPAPDAVPATAGAVAFDTAGDAKPGVAAGLPAVASAGNAPAADVSPDLAGRLVVNNELVDLAGSQTAGKATCPAGKVALGGGVIGNSDSFLQNVNSSYPLVSNGVATGWAGYVNNATNDDLVFIVYAVCAPKPPDYAVVYASFDNPAGEQSIGSVACPFAASGKRMVPFGGGGYGGSSSLGQNLNTTIPVKTTRSWRVDMNNASASAASFKVYAVCGLRPGWTVVAGAPVLNPAGSQTSAGAACPAGLTSVGGGLFSSSPSTAADVNGTVPESASSWRGFENNNSATKATVTPYVLCLS
jgi:hypothetical protein